MVGDRNGDSSCANCPNLQAYESLRPALGRWIELEQPISVFYGSPSLLSMGSGLLLALGGSGVQLYDSKFDQWLPLCSFGILTIGATDFALDSRCAVLVGSQDSTCTFPACKEVVDFTCAPARLALVPTDDIASST